MALRRCRGPGVVVGLEGRSGVHVTFRGRTTKCAPERARRASHRERLAKVAWDSVLDNLREQAQPEPTEPAEDVDAPEDPADDLPADQPAEEIPVDVPQPEESLELPNGVFLSPLVS